MPSITLHPPARSPSTASGLENPLPQLLHTPSGLAILEVQGTFHFPASDQSFTQVGKFVFPFYNPLLNDPSDTKWMKRVYLYVGKGQRMTGECKKLAKPIGIIRKREKRSDGKGEDVDMGGVGEEDLGRLEEDDDVEKVQDEELEIVEVVKYKIVFSARPEPISGVEEAE
ncbi:chromosome transmission fidelity protein 8 [Pyrenochaeta sp. MPI-SDFR-AT-0127]|nr:chromosome transmission fidelity protein 8 [Pyrenochaeta sp. MPI-SDFR-AT-0127]